MTVEQENGGDQFPIGMRVLAVDDDATCLMYLETLLRRCQYHGLFLFLLRVYRFGVLFLENLWLNIVLKLGFCCFFYVCFLLNWISSGLIDFWWLRLVQSLCLSSDYVGFWCVWSE